MKSNFFPILVLSLAQSVLCGAKDNPQPENATIAVLRAFEKHDILMIGEIHANKQEYDWYGSLVATPEFADRIDDIVLEICNSLYQHSVDQYVAGENIPFEQVQEAWRNIVGLDGPPSPLIEDLYKAVREANMRRPGKHQIRIICGGPALDWRMVKDTVKGLHTVSLYTSRRDEWYAQVVQEQVIAKHHRALLIMGAMHFLRDSPTHSGRSSIESTLRKAGAKTYLVLSGTNTPKESCQMDHRFDPWPSPSIVPARGWLGKFPARSLIEGGGYPDSKPKLKNSADAFLYLGPRDSLTSLSMTRAQLADTPYGKEIERE